MNLNPKTGESGGNKSGVDMNFGLNKGEIGRAVSEGMGELDVSSADTIVRALNYKEVASVCVAVSVIRENTVKLIEGKQIKEGKFQLHSTRIYTYDENKRPVEACLYEQSYLEDIKPPKTIRLHNIWPNTNDQYDGVIPDIEMHKPLEFPLTRQFPDVRTPKSMDDMIKRATIVHTSRIEKEAALHDRKIECDERKKSLKAAQYQMDVARTEKSRKTAAEHGCHVLIPCPTNGNIKIIVINCSTLEHHRTYF